MSAASNVHYGRDLRAKAKQDNKVLATIDYEGQYLKSGDRNRLTAQMLLTPSQGRRLILFYVQLTKEQSAARKRAATRKRKCPN